MFIVSALELESPASAAIAQMAARPFQFFQAKSAPTLSQEADDIASFGPYMFPYKHERRDYIV